MANGKLQQGTVSVLRILFGAWNLFFGIVFFTNFPIPQPMGHGPMTPYLNQTLIDTHLFHVVKTIEIIVGLLLLGNRAVPLALCAYFPITVVIFVVNMFLEELAVAPIIAIVYAAAHLYLFWAYRRYYLPMLAWKATIADSAA